MAQLEALRPFDLNDMNVVPQQPINTYEIEPHHTEERRLFLEEVVAGKHPRYLRRLETYEMLQQDSEALDAFRRLLLHVDQYMDVLKTKTMITTMKGSKLIRGLGALALHHQHWIRPLEAWHTPLSKNGHPRRHDQFSTLLRHLLARYEIPKFLDTAWFEDPNVHGLTHQKWFIHLATGGSVADLKMDIQFTHRMAHLFMHAPPSGTIRRNMRWAQVIGMGGDHVLARAVLKTRLGRNHDNDEFWRTVVQFLVNNAMMDPIWVGPIVDYISNMKFAPRRIVQEGGGVVEGPPPQPNFTMKGRSAVKLLRQIETWHGELGREKNVMFQSWQACGIRPWEMEDETEKLGKVRWTVQEMLSSWELAAHGREMHHCVVSYSDRCADGKIAVWSICAHIEGETEREEVLTVALDIKAQTVTQARGRYNQQPNKAPKSAQAKRETQTGYFDLLNRSNVILNQWMQREQLTHDQ